MLFKPPRLWYFVVAALARECAVEPLPHRNCTLAWRREGKLPKIHDDAYFTRKGFHSSLLPDSSAFNCLPACSLIPHSSREMSSKSDHIIPLLKNPSCGSMSLRIEAKVIIQIKNRPVPHGPPWTLWPYTTTTSPLPYQFNHLDTLTPKSFYFLGAMDRLLFLPLMLLLQISTQLNPSPPFTLCHILSPLPMIRPAHVQSDGMYSLIMHLWEILHKTVL